MICHGCGKEIVLTNGETMVRRDELVIDGVGKEAKNWHGECYDRTHDPAGNYVEDFVLDSSGFHPKMPEENPKEGPWTYITFERRKQDGEA